MKSSIISSPIFKKGIVHAIVAIITINLVLQMYNPPFVNKWAFYTFLVNVSAFYLHALLILPMLTIQRKIKQYVIYTSIGFLICAYTINWFEAVRASEIIFFSDGAPTTPSYFFFQTEWLLGVLLAGLIIFVPLFLLSFIYHLFLITKEQRKRLFSFKYIESIANIIIGLSLLLFVLLINSRNNIQALQTLIQFLTFSIVFYFNAFFYSPAILKDKKVGKYILLNILSLGLVILSTKFVFSLPSKEVVLSFQSFIPASILFFIVSILSFVYAYIRLKLKTNEQLFDLKLGAKESELQLLKSQVNPHFLFNTLNTLYATALKENAPKTAESVAKLANLIRYMQNDIDKDFILLENEINYVKDYISIQKLRLAIAPKIITTFEVDQGATISPGLLIPLVENAFKYGIHPTKTSIITISITTKERQISFYCENQYDENLKIHQMNEGFGIGIENVKKRLQLIYPKQHTFEILKENNIFSVQLTITNNTI